MMYTVLSPQESLSQGDILDGCPIFGLEASESGFDVNGTPARWWERVLVLTQACDLAHGKTTKVLVALLHPAQEVAALGILKAQTIRDQVRRNTVYGWYFLPGHPASGLPESIVDLHDLHTVPSAVLERLILDGKRICRLLPPFREHLAQHFAVTYMRIGLPAPYETEP